MVSCVLYLLNRFPFLNNFGTLWKQLRQLSNYFRRFCASNLDKSTRPGPSSFAVGEESELEEVSDDESEKTCGSSS